MTCYDGIIIPDPIEETCQGDYTSTNCVINPNALTYLNLPANSTMSTIVSALILALIYKDQVISELQDQITALTP